MAFWLDLAGVVVQTAVASVAVWQMRVLQTERRRERLRPLRENLYEPLFRKLNSWMQADIPQWLGVVWISDSEFSWDLMLWQKFRRESPHLLDYVPRQVALELDGLERLIESMHIAALPVGKVVSAFSERLASEAGVDKNSMAAWKPISESQPEFDFPWLEIFSAVNLHVAGKSLDDAFPYLAGARKDERHTWQLFAGATKFSHDDSLRFRGDLIPQIRLPAVRGPCHARGRTHRICEITANVA